MKKRIMMCDAPWEGTGCGYETVFRDGPILRMYYIAADLTNADGYSFHRFHEAFLRPGPQRHGNWVYGDCYQSPGLIEMPAPDPTAPPELAFYVGENHWIGPKHLRRCTLRIDGFASLRARSRGEFLTKPLTFRGQKIYERSSFVMAGCSGVDGRSIERLTTKHDENEDEGEGAECGRQTARLGRRSVGHGIGIRTGMTLSE